MAGCGGPEYEVVPVAGQVTLDGKAVPGAYVVFQPIGMEFGEGKINPGPGSVGRTDAEGRFALEIVDPARPGAVVGEHAVRIRMHREAAPRDDMGQPIADPLPTKCRDGSMRFTVPEGGTEDARFDLKSG